MKERQVARYFFTVFKPRERKSGFALLSISFSLFLSASFSLSLIYPASPLLKRQKFLIELLFFAGDFLELQKGKNEKRKQFFLRRHSTPPTYIPILYREFFDYIRKKKKKKKLREESRIFLTRLPISIEYRSNTTKPFSRLIYPRNRPPYSFLWFFLPIAFFS